MATRSEVYAVIDGERQYQEDMGATHGWGKGQGAKNHSVGDFLTMMQAYLDLAHRDYVSWTGDEASLHVIRKITALGVACMEQNGAPARQSKTGSLEG